MSKVGVASIYQDIPDIKAISSPNHAAYCQRHGYELIESVTLFPTRPPSWSKILLLQQHLPAYDWMLWLDADALITNPAIRVEDLLSDYDLLVSSDPVSRINMGVFLIRNSPASFTLLESVWNAKVFTRHIWWEQAALLHLMDTRQIGDTKIEVAPYRKLQSWPRSIKHGRDNWWEPNDYIVHFPGMAQEERVLRMKQWGKSYAG